MSIGVASYPQHGDSPDGLIRAADEALYQAKEQGRNRYVASGAKPRKKSPAKRGAAARRKPKTGQAGKTAKDEPKA
jgi:predicted signal transduction protein with EAL and GGDEF domain